MTETDPAAPATAGLFDSPLAQAVSAAGIGLWELDLASGREWWSDATLALYGLPPGSPAPGRDAWREHFVHPDDLARQMATAAESERTGGPYECEFRIRRADTGAVRRLISRSTVNLAGSRRVLGITLDVTDRHDAERRAVTAEAHLGHAARQVGFGFGTREPDDEGGEWSPELKRLWGLPADAPTPRRAEIFEHIVPADRERVRQRLYTPIEPGALAEYSFELRRADDGRCRTLTTRAYTEYGAAGRRGRTYFAVIDTTELLQRERELADLQELQRLAAEAAGLGLWELDLRSGQHRWDERTRALFDLAPGDPPLERHEFMARLHPDDRGRMVEAVAAADSRGEPIDIEYRVSRGDGGWRWLRARGRVLAGADGRPWRSVGVCFETTALRQAEAERHARELAENANAAKTEFLSRMSHELRTPLNAVLGFAQLRALDSADPLTSTQRERLQHVQAAGWHLLALVNDVLDLARIESRNAPMQPEAVALGAAVTECIAMTAPRSAEAGVAVHWDSPEAGPHAVWADPVRLRQLLLNLVSNGVKYNRRGGWVRVGARRRGAQAVVSVRDNGLGIARARLPRLFQPFDRAGRESSGIEGTGLGLALVKLLVEQMGGAVEVDSTEGEGSEFRLVLPLPPADGGPRPLE
ncbi:MAG: PAS domain-containing protein [Betaproteobacteria bacterium]